MNYIYIFLVPFIILLLNNFLTKKSFLLNFTGEKHQNFTIQNKIPLSGGIIICLSAIILFDNNLLSIFIFLLFLLGILSDLKKINSAKIRLIIQILILFGFIFLSDLKLENTNVIFLDRLIIKEINNYLFVLFCILILVNGTNFIDGLNTNVLGYYILVSSFLYYVNPSFFLSYNENWFLWIFLLLILFIFNLRNKLFIGDNGSYILGFLYSFILISFYSFSQSISSFYIIVLCWYPCFETLFSILRKLRLSNSPIKPDTKHLHQLLFILIFKKFKFSKYKTNILCASIINILNFIIFLIASLNAENTEYQIMIIMTSVITYCYLYFRLFNKIYLKK